MNRLDGGFLLVKSFSLPSKKELKNFIGGSIRKTTTLGSRRTTHAGKRHAMIEADKFRLLDWLDWLNWYYKFQSCERQNFKNEIKTNFSRSEAVCVWPAAAKLLAKTDLRLINNSH